MKCSARKILIVLAYLALALGLCGCSLETSAENLFTLPQVPVEYTGLANTLNSYLDSGYEYITPSSGNNIQSLQMIDMDGDGEKEAVAFFRRTADDNPLKILFFREENGTFSLYSTIESGGTSIDSVSFRDFNGDGRLEVAVGWRVSTEVQTVAVYELKPNQANVLMQSGYLRYVVDDLDSDGRFDLLLIRSETEGGCLAEHYTWQEGEMRVGGTCQLRCTPAELNRGSIVCGKLDSQQTAAFVTAVNGGNTAMTNILLCRGGRLINVGADAETGVTEVQYPFSQLRPQDINSDGIIEIPYPEKNGTRQTGAFFAWYRFDDRGNSVWVMDTYNDLTDGWYLVLNDDWHGNMNGTRLDTTENGTCVTLQVGGKPVLYLYSLSGEERERDAQTGGRTLVMQRANVAYAMRITDDGAALGISSAWVSSHFNLISTAWSAGN